MDGDERAYIGGDSGAGGTITINGGTEYKLVLVDGETFAPLCEAGNWNSEAPKD